MIIDRLSAKTCVDCFQALKVLPSEQLAASAGFRPVVLQGREAVRGQDAVTLFSQSIMVRRVPLRQLAGVSPRQQRVLQNSIPLFVPQKNLAPLLTRNLSGRKRKLSITPWNTPVNMAELLLTVNGKKHNNAKLNNCLLEMLNEKGTAEGTLKSKKMIALGHIAILI